MRVLQLGLDGPPLVVVALVRVVDLDELALDVRFAVVIDRRIRPHLLVKVPVQVVVFFVDHRVDAGVHVDFDPRALLPHDESSLFFALELDGVVFGMVRVEVDEVDQRGHVHVLQAALQDVARDVGPVFGSKVVDVDADVDVGVVVDVVVDADAGAVAAAAAAAAAAAVAARTHVQQLSQLLRLLGQQLPHLFHVHLADARLLVLVQVLRRRKRPIATSARTGPVDAAFESEQQLLPILVGIRARALELPTQVIAITAFFGSRVMAPRASHCVTAVLCYNMYANLKSLFGGATPKSPGWVRCAPRPPPPLDGRHLTARSHCFIAATRASIVASHRTTWDEPQS